MATITIPKKITKKGDLIVLPREDYEALLRASKKTVLLPDEDLKKALIDLRSGRVYGPFNSTKDLKRSLLK